MVVNNYKVIVVKKMARILTSWSIPEDERWVLDELRRLAKLEGASINALVTRALKEYLQKHREGNPQIPLFPQHELLHPYVNPVVEARRNLLADLLADIRSHPGTNRKKLEGEWGRIHGLREETARAYINQLLRAKKIVNKFDRLYPVIE